MIEFAGYLANKPSGWPAVYLIVAVTLCVISAGYAASIAKDPWRAGIALALGMLALALLTH